MTLCVFFFARCNWGKGELRFNYNVSNCSLGNIDHGYRRSGIFFVGLLFGPGFVGLSFVDKLWSTMKLH